MIRKMRFWGTSAGEATPTPFCECPICQNAREVGRKELRLRSSFRIDEKTMIDVGADFAAAAQKMGESLYDIEHILYTHTHEDHFNYMVFWTRFVARKRLDRPVNVYFTEDAYSVIDEFVMTSKVTEGREHYMIPENVKLVKLNFGEEYSIGELKVTPLRGNHGTAFEKNSANYLIKLPDGRTMYYALDSGYYLEETFEKLRSEKIDILINECTMPFLTDDGKNSNGHMNLYTALRTFERLYDQKTISNDTKIYLTHIAPIGSTHAELCDHISKLSLPYSVEVAYDGLSID